MIEFSQEGQVSENDEENDLVPNNLFADLVLPSYKNYLIGPNIWLRPIFPRDYEGLVSILADADSMKYFDSGKAYLEKEAIEITEFWALENNLNLGNKRFRWAVICKEGIVGFVSIRKSDEPDERYEIVWNMP